ncbi:D-erythronate dehydrogenase [Ovoidimarina sediminis]|uniref:D-erythronate dehydrogenase n=1 Tax=Ovoidimarina sediminis TaxID=3079856 RepID=UPI00291416A7|nr:D-erythronate dehydrogenase [Rhodophyticola sp. MJ-SS7]MDU8942066.1 SDR family oxidoreductase [Rhodophyticola sp. MJ-SS7]
MTKVLIIGGGGMVGQKLAHRIARSGLPGMAEPEVTLYDIAFPDTGAPAHHRITGDLSAPGAAEAIAELRADVVFHLAAIVSGAAEADFDLGWRINGHAFWAFLEAMRTVNEASEGDYRAKVIFTSSIAVFGPPYPDRIGDEFLASPQTSYGAQKAMAEILLQDYSRKGFVDGLSIRLPTICVRPGKPNKAASSFFSGIIREPLAGQEAILPVPRSVRHWHASPRSAAGFLSHAAGLDFDGLDGRRVLNLPGVSCTVEEQIEALREVAGSKVVELIREEPDETIQRIVFGWPRNFDPARAIELGFTADQSFRSIIDTYIAEDMPRD